MSFPRRNKKVYYSNSDVKLVIDNRKLRKTVEFFLSDKLISLQKQLLQMMIK